MKDINIHLTVFAHLFDFVSWNNNLTSWIIRFAKEFMFRIESRQNIHEPLHIRSISDIDGPNHLRTDLVSNFSANFFYDLDLRWWHRTWSDLNILVFRAIFCTKQNCSHELLCHPLAFFRRQVKIISYHDFSHCFNGIIIHDIDRLS